MNEKSKVVIETDGENYCFGCSKDNPNGLQMEFVCSEGSAEAVFTPGMYHQGWPGITHGGILFSLMDEAGGYAVRSAGVDCVTARSEAKFLNPAFIGTSLKVSARIVKQTSRTVETEAFLYRDDGTPVASVSSLWYIVGKTSEADLQKLL